MTVDHESLLSWLSRLKLTAIRDQLDSLLDEAAKRELTLREALAFFGEREIARKDQRRIEMAVKIAHFPSVRDLDGFDFAAQPALVFRASGRHGDCASSAAAVCAGAVRPGNPGVKCSTPSCAGRCRLDRCGGERADGAPRV